MSDTDLSLLKAIADETAAADGEDGRWESAEKAVDAVLRVLYDSAPATSELWGKVYEAIKDAYVEKAEW